MRSKIDYKEITKLIDIMEERNLSEFELELEGFKVRLSKERKKTAPPEETSLPLPETPGAEEPQTPLINEDMAARENNLHFIRSPMIGTFYRAPDPNSPPFVEIGDTVKPNQTVCIIEAMKLMNEIEAETEGTIEEIFIKNGKPVEYGQKLFTIKLS